MIDALRLRRVFLAFSLFAESAIALAKDKEGRSNPITIGWGGLGTLFSRSILTVYIHKTRYSKKVFDEAEEFAVCFFDKEHQKEINDYYGRVSGKDEDKMAGGVFTPIEIGGMPAFKEAKLILIARKIAQSDFDASKIYDPRIKAWYDRDDVHTIYNGVLLKALKAI